MPNQNYIMEDFFHQRSPEMAYVLGTFYACYAPRGRTGIAFQSANKDLVMLVHSHLYSEHSIAKAQGANSWYFQAKGVPAMRRWLDKQGLSMPKKERKFPNIDEEILDHFVRGYIDAQASIQQKGELLTMLLGKLTPFKRGLHDVLREHAHVLRSEPTTVLRYGHNDCMRIRNFLYRDPKYRRWNIYLPSMEEVLDTPYRSTKGGGPENQVRRLHRSLHAAKILTTGRFDKDVKCEAGYTSSASLREALIACTGKNPTQIREEAILVKAKKLLLAGELTVHEIAQACHCTEFLLQRLFRDHEGMTARAWANSASFKNGPSFKKA